MDRKPKAPRGRGDTPRGRGSRGGGHKGQRRRFTNPDALEREREKEERERRWRQQKGDDVSDEEEEGGEGKEKEEKDSDSSSEESESEDDGKIKGVQHLIDIQNPNRVVKKTKKVETLTVEEVPEKQQLSRREREELEKQKARAHYMKMHAAGKTEEAREDLARLALIRKQREEMVKKRDEEKKLKDAAKEAKTQEINKALGKKT